MPVDKRTILKESVRKLLALKVTDDEVVSNLRDIGVSPREARLLLNETKRELAASGVPEAAPATAEEEEPAEEEPDLEAEAEPLPRSSSQPSRAAPASKSFLESAGIGMRSPQPDRDIAELWEKGILATVDAKLEQMERLKRDMDKKISDKTAAAVDREIKKMQVIFGSQRTLMIEKINSQLDARGNEVLQSVKDKMSELKKIDELARTSMAKIESQRAENAALLSDVEAKVASLDKLKSSLISEMNSSIIKSKSEIESFIETSKKQRDDMQMRINRAIELESKIREGLMEDAKVKIDKMALEKSDTLTHEIQKRIKELDDMKGKLDPEGIKAALVEMRALRKQFTDKPREIENAFERSKAEFSRLNDRRLEEMKKESSAQVRALLEAERAVWDKAIKAKAEDMDELVKELDVDKIMASMEEFRAFRQQFVNVIKKNVDGFNAAKKELTAELERRQKTFDAHIAQIDGKLKELDDFERNFAKEMGIALDKLTEREKGKSGKKKGK
ncbi:MAG: hypothetical protein V1676_02330 [Candidatus Diapherotrites archaeon]